MQQSNTEGEANKKQKEIIESYYSLITKLLIVEDYKGIEDPISKLQTIDPKCPCIDQLLSSIINDQNCGKSILSTSERYSQDYSKVAKKLGLKKVLKKQEGNGSHPRNTSSIKGDTNFISVQENHIRRKNSDYQDLLIRMLELKPELQKRIMKINNLSNNYCKPLLADAYNHYSRTKDIRGTIKKIKDSIDKEGYNISAGISLAQLYETKERHCKSMHQSEKEWNKIIELLLNDKDVNFKTIEHCAPGNKVKKYVHTQQYAGLEGHSGFTLIFKTGQKEGKLKREKDAVERLKRVSKQNKLNIPLPEIKLFVQKEDLEHFIMESPGMNVLDQAIASNPYQVITEIVDQIVKIHQHFPADLLEQTHSREKEENKQHYSKRLKEKLFENLKMSLGRKREYINKIDHGSILSSLDEYDLPVPTKECRDTKKCYYIPKKFWNFKKNGKETNLTYQKSQVVYVNEDGLVFDLSLEQKFFENYEALLNIISELKEGVYKDASLKNWIRVYKSDEEQYVNISIDYGTLRNSPHQFDLANVLESIPHEIPSYRDLLLRCYHTTLSKTKNLGNFEDFKKGYHACAVHKCLINIGNSLRFFLEDTDKHKNYILDIKKQSENLRKDCKNLFNNAKWNLNELKEYYSNSSEEYNKLTGLEMQLSKINEYIIKE